MQFRYGWNPVVANSLADGKIVPKGVIRAIAIERASLT